MYALQAGIPRNLVYNSLNQSAILSGEDVHFFQLHIERLPWKLMSEAQVLSGMRRHQVFKLVCLHPPGNVAHPQFPSSDMNAP